MATSRGPWASWSAPTLTMCIHGGPSAPGSRLPAVQNANSHAAACCRCPGPSAEAWSFDRQPDARGSPFAVLCLQQVQVHLPLVANHFAAGEAAHWDDHGVCCKRCRTGSGPMQLQEAARLHWAQLGRADKAGTKLQGGSKELGNASCMLDGSPCLGDASAPAAGACFVEVAHSCPSNETPLRRP